MKHILFTIFLTLILIGNIGCTSPRQNEPLRVGINNQIPSQVLHLSRNLGFYLSQDIEITTVQTDTELLNALSSGAIDAATVKLVQAQEILKKDNTFEIVLFMSIPKGMISVSESAGNIDVLLMRKSIAKKDPQKVATLLNGWDSTVAYIDIHPEQTVEFFSKQLNIEPNSVNSQISLNRWGTTELNKEISLDLAEK